MLSKIVVLAAGKSTRFQSKKHKALHDLLGKTILERVLDNLIDIESVEIYFVLGHQKEEIIKKLPGFINNVEQKEQLGTAHALQVALESHKPLHGKQKGILVTCIDTPLIQEETLKKFIAHVQNNNASVGIITAELENPTGYGRILRNPENPELIAGIIEEKDTIEEQKEIKEINSGIYYFNISEEELQENLNKIQNLNNQKEYYLTDLIEILNDKNHKIITYQTNQEEILGINTKYELTEAIKILNNRTINKLMNKGVIFTHPESCLISPEVHIGLDTTIGQNCCLSGNTSIGEDCQIRFSQVVDAQIGNNCSIGPFANIRSGTRIADNTLIGDFVEIKNSSIGSNSFVSHLSYIGDAEVGDDVNIGAGTITANFNAITGSKTKTIINDHVKTGSNSVLIAPIEIAEGCMIAAGSVITENIEKPYSLGVARIKQEIRENWVKEKQSS